MRTDASTRHPMLAGSRVVSVVARRRRPARPKSHRNARLLAVPARLDGDVVIARLRGGAGARWRSVRLQIRRFDKSSGADPDLLVVGAQRGGTTSLYRWLAAHPQVNTPIGKEVQFFSDEFGRGLGWYRRHFGSDPLRLDFEASPYYLYHPLAPVRVGDLLPDVKIVALLRDPVERARSHYYHNVSVGLEWLPIAEAITAEEERIAGEAERLVADPEYVSPRHRHFSYVDRGRYDVQFERWNAACPGRMLVLPSTDVFRDPARTFARIQEFVGLDPWFPPDFKNESRRPTAPTEDLDQTVSRRIRDLVALSVERLAGMVDFDPTPWLDSSDG